MENLNALIQFVDDINPPVVKFEFLSVLHKLRYPMADILAKVPGDTIADRARAIGVSRQTMYIWTDEKFRPAPAVAKRISKLTGVPAEHIRDLEDGHDVGGSPRKAAAKLAGGGKAASAVHGRTGRGSGPRRVVAAQKRSRVLRKVRKRTGG
jgi:DNA-binding XRE family transcriptional regulator